MCLGSSLSASVRAQSIHQRWWMASCADDSNLNSILIDHRFSSRRQDEFFIVYSVVARHGSQEIDAHRLALINWRFSFINVFTTDSKWGSWGGAPTSQTLSLFAFPQLTFTVSSSHRHSESEDLHPLHPQSPSIIGIWVDEFEAEFPSGKARLIVNDIWWARITVPENGFNERTKLVMPLKERESQSLPQCRSS